MLTAQPKNQPETELLLRRLRVLEAVQNALLEVAAVPQFHARLQRIAEVASGLTHAQLAALAVFDQRGDVQEFFTAGIPPEVRHLIGAFPSGKGMFATLFSKGESLRLAHVSEYPLSAGFPPHHPQITGFLGVPIRADDKICGAFYMANRADEREFSDEDQEILETFSKHISFEIALNPWVRNDPGR